MQHFCVGFLELATIAKGVQVTDALLKKALVKIILAKPVSSGKYLVCFRGEVEDVKSSLAAGKEVSGPTLLDSFLLPAIHAEIIPAMLNQIRVDGLEAIGIIETVTCAACIVAADVALKTSQVRLIKLQLAQGIGGKAYFIINGEVGEIVTATSAAMRYLQKQNIAVVDNVVIHQAAPELLAIFQ
jgi:microcompartment protein CcmL/EutN